MAYVERDTTWSGEVRIDGVVHIRKGATLTVIPGTRVIFAAKRFSAADEHEGFYAPGIHAEGRILAEGTAKAPIIFTSSTQPALPGSWDKILFSFSTENRFEHCIFEGGRYAFHAHYSEITIRNCLYRSNEEGVRLGVSRILIENSVFTGNEVRGINFRECRNTIRRNLVYGNGDGIFYHSKNTASTVRENAIYGNRNFNAHLGDLYSDDVDLSGNWWGTDKEEEARATIYDGRNQPGVGMVRISPVLPRPPVTGSSIGGVFVDDRAPVGGAVVRAYRSVAGGFWGGGHVAESVTDENGRFLLPLPPGRYFISGRAEVPAGMLFSMPGSNPVSVSLGETREVGMPAVPSPPKGETRRAEGSRSSIVVRTTWRGKPEKMVSVQASRPDAPDFRGAGEASALTDEEGIARLYPPPGKYILSARKRLSGAAVGMLDEGGLFGVYPYSPVELSSGSLVSVEIPLARKRGFLADDAGIGTGVGTAGSAEGIAMFSGKAAKGFIVFFYAPPETIGRPAARSSVVSGTGKFSVRLPEDGEYFAYLRKAIESRPADAEEERAGPVTVRLKNGRFIPETLSFSPQGR